MTLSLIVRRSKTSQYALFSYSRAILEIRLVLGKWMEEKTVMDH